MNAEASVRLAANHRARWMQDAGWGLFIHYLGTKGQSAEAWNIQVDRVDVEGLAEQLASVGAGYLIFTVGQNSGHTCSPNAAYDRCVRAEPSLCSRRDLVADLAQALDRRGIRLLAYAPSMPPMEDPAALAAFECPRVTGAPTRGQAPEVMTRLEACQRRWESVLREWSERWGRLVHGWWIDGCYYADLMYRHADEPNFASLASALRAGNPARVLSFATGPMPWIQPCLTQTDAEEDFTNGETNSMVQVDFSSRTGTALTHQLVYLGTGWSQGEPRFPDALVAGLTRLHRSRGAVTTWEVPTDRRGVIPPAYLRQLSGLRPTAGQNSWA